MINAIEQVTHALGQKGFENFGWWCSHGDRDMCAAVLWRNHGFTMENAKKAVAAITARPYLRQGDLFEPHEQAETQADELLAAPRP